MYKEKFDLTGRVAIVTGGSRGIGEAIAIALAEFGAKVVLSSRKIEGLNAVKEKIEAAGGEAICIPAHVGKLDSLQAVVDGAVETYGTVDILVNNAATNPIFGPVMQADESAWNKIMDVNLKGIFFLTKAVGKVMLEKQKGAIINISTEAALRPTPGIASPYAMTHPASFKGFSTSRVWASTNPAPSTINARYVMSRIVIPSPAIAHCFTSVSVSR